MKSSRRVASDTRYIAASIAVATCLIMPAAYQATRYRSGSSLTRGVRESVLTTNTRLQKLAPAKKPRGADTAVSGSLWRNASPEEIRNEARSPGMKAPDEPASSVEFNVNERIRIGAAPGDDSQFLHSAGIGRDTSLIDDTCPRK
jgi:hypothetical protein